MSAKKPFYTRYYWPWVMAWRDARHHFSKLFLFVISLVVGIAAMVTISSLNYTLQEDINQNTKQLLGADIVVRHTQPFDEKFLMQLDSVGIDHEFGMEMFSMALFVGDGNSRLVRVIAFGESYPFYGKIETNPSNGFQKIQTQGYVVMNETLVNQYDLHLMDSVKIGNAYLRMAGSVRKAPGVGGMTMYVPAVYISLADLQATGLIKYGSRITYTCFLKTYDDEQTEQVLRALKPNMIKQGYRYTTVEQQKKNIGKNLKSIYRFFSLLAFISLILGSVGVVSSVHVYACAKRSEVAMLRCLGTSGGQAFTIFFIQIFVLGFLGSVLGVGLGTAVQQLTAGMLSEYAIAELQPGIVWPAVREGLLLGLVVSALFGASPLLAIRSVSPLEVLRVDVQSGKTFSFVQWYIAVPAVLFPFLAAWYQTENIFYALGFSIGLYTVCASLFFVARGLLYITKKYLSNYANFFFRHAFSNLFRPYNQTVMLIVSIGLGVFIMTILSIVQHSLLQQIEVMRDQNRSNAILFDIQTAQKENVIQTVQNHDLILHQMVPIVTCRLQTLHGKSIEQIRKDSANTIPEWALAREYRVTYRDRLHTSEHLVQGEIQNKETTGTIWVTVSEDMMQTLLLEISDSLVFDVQGVPVPVKLGGVRYVDWPEDPPNFIFVFPRGVLEQAPQTWVATMRIPDEKTAGPFQRELVMQFPNISFIDLRLVLKMVNDLLGKMGLTIRFLAFFSVIVGLCILAGAVFNGRHARMIENTLLRAIGASTHQLSKVALIEYFYLGIFSILSGLILSFILGWVLTFFLLDVPFSFLASEIFFIAIATFFITLLVGWLNARIEVNVPPIVVLRRGQ